MKQQTGQTTSKKRRKTRKRVATRDLLRIGQRWQRRTRKRVKPEPVVIYQIYRHEKAIITTARERITFTELTSKYKLIKEEPT